METKFHRSGSLCFFASVRQLGNVNTFHCSKIAATLSAWTHTRWRLFVGCVYVCCYGGSNTLPPLPNRHRNYVRMSTTPMLQCIRHHHPHSGTNIAAVLQLSDSMVFSENKLGLTIVGLFKIRLANTTHTHTLTYTHRLRIALCVRVYRENRNKFCRRQHSLRF